jgi:hypothetical protein
LVMLNLFQHLLDFEKWNLISIGFKFGQLID